MKREDFLARVRHALHHKPGEPISRPPELLEPLAHWDSSLLVDAFRTELQTVGGHVHLVSNMQEARDLLPSLLQQCNAASFICSHDPIVDEVLSVVSLPEAPDIAAADVGITGVAYALANTGTMVLSSEAGRLASLLPMHHIALIRAEQVVPSMAEALELRLAQGSLPTAWVQATGPSRTADIEFTLTTGVHGPGIVHAVVIR